MEIGNSKGGQLAKRKVIAWWNNGCFTFGRWHCVSGDSQNSRRRIRTTNSEDNSLRMQPSMMRLLKEGGVMTLI